jgi:hypothetical protein
VNTFLENQQTPEHILHYLSRLEHVDGSSYFSLSRTCTPKPKLQREKFFKDPKTLHACKIMCVCVRINFTSLAINYVCSAPEPARALYNDLFLLRPSAERNKVISLQGGERDM